MIKKYSSKLYKWYSVNTQKIIFVIGLHFIFSYIANLPYFNIFTSLLSFLPYLFDWIAILILFKPSKELIIKGGISLFIIGFLAALVKLNFVLEVLGQVSFFIIATYVILALKEIKSN